MSSAASESSLDPMFGTSGNDVISVDKTVSFTWVPDPGNSFVGSELVFDEDTSTYSPVSETGPSTASGTVTFDMPSSQPTPDGAAASSFDFRFTKYADIGSWIFDMGSNVWNWNPATGVLDPGGSGAGFYDGAAFFTVNQANYGLYRGTENDSAQDSGHWAIVPNPINVDVFGGAGDDTIYGGQGQEVLSGDAGNDTIYAGYGDDVVLGGKGNDALHGGVGTQFLDGGSGNDTIRGGTGTQVIMGGIGADLIWGGNGHETLTGGAGDDTIWGGSGDQMVKRARMSCMLAPATTRCLAVPGTTISPSALVHPAKMSLLIFTSARTLCRSRRD